MATECIFGSRYACIPQSALRFPPNTSLTKLSCFAVPNRARTAEKCEQSAAFQSACFGVLAALGRLDQTRAAQGQLVLTLVRGALVEELDARASVLAMQSASNLVLPLLKQVRSGSGRDCCEVWLVPCRVDRGLAESLRSMRNMVHAFPCR